MGSGNPVTGVHHVSILTNSAERTHDFWTRTLGLQLSAKSVNQEQYGMYHLFYSDAAGAPGTLVTFFDMPLAAPLRPGTGGFSRTSLRVRDAEAVGWWADRLGRAGVEHEGPYVQDGRTRLDFTDPTGTRLAVMADARSAVAGLPVPGTDIPAGFHLLGLGPALLEVRDPAAAGTFLRLLGFRTGRAYRTDSGPMQVCAVPGADASAEIHVLQSAAAPRRYGSGGVHHLALTVPDAEALRSLLGRAAEAGFEASAVLDRGWFDSGYLTGPEGIIIELATPGTGFRVQPGGIVLQGPVTLPRFLEAERESIMERLRPLGPEGEDT